MIVLTVDKTQLAQLKKKLEGLSPKQSGSIMRKAFLELATQVQHRLVDNVSGRILNVRTGNLRRSIHVRMFDRSNTYSALIGSGVLTGNRVVYANIHETGGIIRPKYKKFLVFKPHGANYWVRTKMVKIPARRYMSRTIEEMQPKVMPIMTNSVEKQLRRVS
jgi:phage gpG-like protein